MDPEDRSVSPLAATEDAPVEAGVRPRTLDEYTGQESSKANLKVFIAAAVGRREPLDHVLFSGPPGLGKTTLAYVIAQEMGVSIKSTSGPIIERGGDLAALLTNLEEGDVLFIDEIHRLNRAVEEVLYSAMEDFQIDIMLGQGPNARSVKFSLPRFTLIGATTRSGLLTAPLRARFGIHLVLDFYTVDELEKILHRSARIMEIPITTDGARELAVRSRGTPRIANRLLRRVRDFAQVQGDGTIDRAIADRSLLALDVDEKGLDKMDRRILATIIEKFGGGPVGVETISAAIGEERDTVEEVYEPYLVQQGYLQRTRTGRVASGLAYHHLGLAPPEGAAGAAGPQGELFE
ncbi:Holliday junction branch migration DNA helicase RuvB [Myxococcota bacterium]|nr:Holliday junction branch migration DNA helicase RuvB [Myxococcota bacterium]